MRSRLVIGAAAGVSAIAVVAAVYFQPRWLLGVVARRSPAVMYFVRSTRKVVALTIDDAPHPAVTPQILDVLRRHGAHATFFVIGDHAQGNDAILERMRREGHELGNHLDRECASIRLSPTEFERELRSVDAIIRPDGPAKWFRPGSGWFNERMLKQARGLGYRCALGSVYPFDTVVRSDRLVARYIRTQVFPGAVIILHDGKAERIRTARVLDAVLPELKREGYEVSTLSELYSTQSALNSPMASPPAPR
jgi:peptidoglycan/xylan/chitin deacetylase (PgdA/CDA1 family)